MNLWPILGRIKELENSSVFLIRFYSGSGKPSSVHNYLKEFADDLKVVIQEGTHFNGKHYKIAPPKAFICDRLSSRVLKFTRGTTPVNVVNRQVYM